MDNNTNLEVTKENTKNNFKKNINIKTIAIFTICGYMVMTLLFHYLAGDSLYFRNSRGNIEVYPPTSGTIELIDGSVVEQNFTAEIQKIDKLSVILGTYGRINAGTVKIELINQNNGTILAAKSFLAKDMVEGYKAEIPIEPALENLYNSPLKIRITSNNTKIGSSPSPMMSNKIEDNKEFSLYINEEKIQGRLCFEIFGEDYIWTGIHYWQFVALGLFAIIMYFIICNIRMKKGKNCRLFMAVFALNKYWFLIKQLVSRDFKSKYKRSVLGVIWSFLNPLLTMSVQYLVFSNLFRFDIPNYPVYLISGIVMFNFFTESCGMTMGSIIGNASLIKKVYVPKYIYPLTRVLSSMVNLIISLVPLLLVVLISGLRPTKAYFLVSFELVCLLIFCLGVGMILASAMVFFRDTQFLWGIISMLWMYITPLFYPESILPENLSFILKINPLYYFVKFTRICIIDGVSPEPIMYMQCFLFAIGSLIIGSLIFKKSQDKFVLYL